MGKNMEAPKTENRMNKKMDMTWKLGSIYPKPDNL